jgi:hypothetical protein
MAAGAAVPAKAGRLAGARFEEGWAVVHGDENNAGWAEIGKVAIMASRNASRNGPTRLLRIETTTTMATVRQQLGSGGGGNGQAHAACRPRFSHDPR